MQSSWVANGKYSPKSFKKTISFFYNNVQMLKLLRYKPITRVNPGPSFSLVIRKGKRKNKNKNKNKNKDKN